MKQLCLDRFQSLSKEGLNSRFFDELGEIVFVHAQGLGMSDRQKILSNLERLWLPIALDLATRRNKLERTLIQGILGGQGTGKSTLCSILEQILNYLCFSVATVSIDDLYKTYEERQALQEKNESLIWRGPPGTHDVDLGLDTLKQCLEQGEAIKVSLPRFDKSLHDGQGDRIEPKVVSQPDILLFEGWFVGVKPISESFFDNPPAPIVSQKDREFAVDCNRNLHQYVPLWDKLDSLIVLYLEDYRLSKKWRKEAEHKMKASGKTGMSDEQINRFVEYFWRSLHPELFIKPLTKTADLVVEVKEVEVGEGRKERIFTLKKKLDLNLVSSWLARIVIFFYLVFLAFHISNLL